MPRIKSTIQSGPVIRTTITQTGAVGPRGFTGPNEVTNETATNLTGVLVGNGEGVRTATPDEVVSLERMQTSLPCPTNISQSRVYQINNLQIGFSDPVELSDDGSIEIDGEGSLYEV